MRKPLKIFHLLASNRWTDREEDIVTLCQDLIRKGHDVHFYCAHHSSNLLEVRANERAVIPGKDLWLLPDHPLLVAWGILRLRRIINRERPDILHLHLSGDHIIGALSARISYATPRIIRTIHHPRTLRPRWYWRWLYGSMTDGFVIHSKSDREQLLKDYPVDPETAVMIRGAVDSTRFHPDHDSRTIRAEFGISPSAPVIGTVSRLEPHRQHERLISEMADLRKVLPTVRLLMVGSGEHLPVLQQLVKKLNLEHHVIFTGHRDRDLPQVYGAMNVCVLLDSGSGISCRSVLEAMACGLPVVAHPMGQLAEAMMDGQTGYFIPEGNTDQLVNRLAELLEDRNTARKMGQAARERIEEHFTREIRVRKMEELYGLLLSRSLSEG